MGEKNYLSRGKFPTKKQGDRSTSKKSSSFATRPFFKADVQPSTPSTATPGPKVQNPTQPAVLPVSTPLRSQPQNTSPPPTQQPTTLPTVANTGGVNTPAERQKVEGTKNLYYDAQEDKYYTQSTWGPGALWWPAPPPQPTPPPQPAPPPKSVYLVGEGNFTYARGYKKGHPDVQIKATAYDQEARVRQYEGAPAALEELKTLAVDTAFEVDATNLQGTASPRQVDELQFNFPHTGEGSGSHFLSNKAHPEYQKFVTSNQRLIQRFFHSAHHKVKSDGKVKLTIKDTGPYKDWQVVDLAQKEGWVLQEEEGFKKPPGYSHVLTKKTEGQVSDTKAKTYTFIRAPGSQRGASGVSPQELADKLTDIGASEQETGTRPSPKPVAVRPTSNPPAVSPPPQTRNTGVSKVPEPLDSEGEWHMVSNQKRTPTRQLKRTSTRH